ncbi:MAG: radical SAM protein [bacterium]
MEPKEAVKEQAILEKRHWVRLTKACNNRCLFCLDTDMQDGTILPAEEVKKEIRRGLELGGERLILSGGDPTIHPNFTDFIEYGRSIGYKGVQCITNGRMFSYRSFCKRALDAGLTEATFSIHGHTPELHDRLVGVSGAFEQTRKGLLNLLNSGRCIVNIDIVINRLNVKHLSDIMEYFIALGIREFDLLQISPYGRAYPENKDILLYDVEEALPGLRKAFQMADDPSLFVWTNRFPVYFLEDFEKLIQDPKKLYDEVNGRHTELFDPYLQDKQPLLCVGERCRHCFVQNFCKVLMRLKDIVDAGEYEIIKLNGEDEELGALKSEMTDGKVLWLRADNAEDAGNAMKKITPTDLRRWILELASYEGAEGFLRSLENLERVVVGRGEDIDRVLAAAGDSRVEIQINTSTRKWLDDNAAVVEGAPEKFILSHKSYELLSKATVNDVPLKEIFNGSRFSGVPVRNIAPCLAPASPVWDDGKILDMNVLGENGKMEIFRFTKYYITDGYFTRSLRCKECVHYDDCRGMHINYVRNFGFKIMEPVKQD